MTTTPLDPLVGRTITKILMSSDLLRFETDAGPLAFTVEGDCCSHSYFYDFHGVRKLLTGAPVVSVAQIDLTDPADDDARKGDVVVAYGYEIVTDDPQYGEVTAVFSFRNDSNGYYGGWMEAVDPDGLHGGMIELTDDEVSIVDRET